MKYTIYVEFPTLPLDIEKMINNYTFDKSEFDEVVKDIAIIGSYLRKVRAFPKLPRNSSRIVLSSHIFYCCGCQMFNRFLICFCGFEMYGNKRRICFECYKKIDKDKNILYLEDRTKKLKDFYLKF